MLVQVPSDKTIATLLVLVKVHHFLLRLDFLRGQIGPFPLLINKEGRALFNCHNRCAFVVALFDFTTNFYLKCTQGLDTEGPKMAGSFL